MIININFMMTKYVFHGDSIRQRTFSCDTHFGLGVQGNLYLPNPLKSDQSHH
jgi:hypothetical protein